MAIRSVVLAILAVILLGVGFAFAYPTNNMLMTTGGSSGGGQTIASVSLSNSTFTNSTANATVGTVSVTMSPASPAFAGTLSVTGTNSGGFHLVGTTLETNSGGTTSGTYSDVNIVATQAGAVGSGQIPPGITPTLTGSSGSIACAIGPNFTGTIPTVAVNAGMTTCLFNFDPSTPTYSNPATYINCLGAATPLFYNADPGNTGGSGCNFTVGADPSFSGTTALISTYANSSAPGCSGATCQLFLMTANSNLTTIAASFPNGYYEEIYRVTPTWSCTSGGNPGCGNPMTSFWSWGSSGQASGANDEQDFIEAYGASLNAYDFAWHNGATAGAFIWQNATTFLGAGYDPTQYHAYGGLWTSDGATASYACSIVDGNNISTCQQVQLTGTSFSARRVLISNNGTSTDATNNIISGFTSVTKYTKAIHVFGCPGGGTTNSGGNCFGSTLFNSGGLTYWH